MGSVGLSWQRSVLVLLLAFCCSYSVAEGSAQADPYVPPELASGATEPSLASSGCPATPEEPYGGEDDAAGELRLLRGEIAEVCVALAARTDEVSHRLWWLVGEFDRAAAQRVLANTLLDELAPLAAPLPVVVEDFEGEPLPVEDPGSDSVAAAVDAAGNAQKEAIWFLIGTVAMASGFALYKVVRP